MLLFGKLATGRSWRIPSGPTDRNRPDMRLQLISILPKHEILLAKPEAPI